MMRYMLTIMTLGLGMTAFWLSQPKSKIIGNGLDVDGHFLDIASAPYLLEKPYMSMTGPRSNHSNLKLDTEARDNDILWITGVETINIDARNSQRVSDEFFCHSNLTFSPRQTTPESHNQSFDEPRHMDWRLFTLVPGRMSVSLPDGFGIPVRAKTRFDYYTMSLNQNRGPVREIRMQTRIRYQRGTAQSLRPLFRRALYVYQQHRPTEVDTTFTTTVGEQQDRKHAGEQCAENCDADLTAVQPSVFAAISDKALIDNHPGATCCVRNASRDGVTNQFGSDNTVHWMVPAGRHEYRTNVTNQLQLPFDTTVHYVTGHLHPYGVSLTLTDLERNEVVFEIDSQDYKDRIGVQHMSEIKTDVGVPIRKNGKYQLTAEYNNTTDQPIDAMGILYFYAAESSERREDADKNIDQMIRQMFEVTDSFNPVAVPVSAKIAH